MILRKFYHEGLAHGSYLIGCPKTGEAVVVDPNRDLEPYIRTAEAEGLRVVAVAETHIHADFVSGSRELATRTGATLYLSALGGPDWQYEFPGTPVQDGTEIRFGAVRLVVNHTPGHTPEHIIFVLYDGYATNPVGAFTGDFIFVGDVGRPDLLEKAAGVANTMEDGARQLYRSLQQFKRYPEAMLIWPAHGSGSPCGKALGGMPETTLGYELAQNPAFQFNAEADFVAWVLQGQPEPPLYFAEMKRINKLGADPIGMLGVRQLAASNLGPLLAGDDYLVDLRPRRWFAAEAIRRVVNVPMGRSLQIWIGSLFDKDERIVLIARDATEASDAVLALRMIGFNNVGDWIQLEACLDEATRLDLVAPVPAHDPDATIIDVRSLSERDEDGVIEGSMHLPMSRLGEQKCRLERAHGRYLVHCYSGARAHVASTYLRRLGYDVTAFTDSFDKLKIPSQSNVLV